MEKRFDYQNSFNNPYGYEPATDYMQEPMLNPAMQYEQMYMYYKYLTQQMEYKIKCKEFDRLTKPDKQNFFKGVPFFL